MRRRAQRRLPGGGTPPAAVRGSGMGFRGGRGARNDRAQEVRRGDLADQLLAAWAGLGSGEVAIGVKARPGLTGLTSKARLMLTTVVSATLPRTSCWARVVRLIPEIRQTSAVLASGAMPCSQRWNALAGRGMERLSAERMDATDFSLRGRLRFYAGRGFDYA